MDAKTITMPNGDVINIKDDQARQDISELNSNLNPTSFSSYSVYQSRCSIAAGGYVKIGKLVVVNVKITVLTTAASGGTVVLLGNDVAPLIGTITALTAWNITQKKVVGAYAYNNTGNLAVADCVTNDEVLISGVFICA